MRRIIGASALLASATIVALVARFGYVSSGTPVSGIIVAILFAVVAVGGLGGHAIAVHLWQRSRTWSIIVGLVALASLGANLSITFDAILGRAYTVPAERGVEPTNGAVAITEERNALDRINREQASLLDYAMITAAAVEAAKAAAAVATESRQAACSSNRGDRCRQREDDERQALAAVAEAKANRAATVRVNALRVELARIQRRLAEAPPPVITTRLAAAPPPERARLFQIPDAGVITAATWQKFALAAIVELLIACAFVAFELMRPKGPQRAGTSLKLIGGGMSRLRPVSEQTPARNVHEYVVDRLEARGGAAVSFSDVYLDYEDWCQHQRTPALAPYDFAGRMAGVCEGIDVYTRERNGIIQFVNVRIAGAARSPGRRIARAIKKLVQSNKQQKDELFTGYSRH
ncbi:MAG: hypothetical protein ACR2OF_03405 [Hyphomicrobium sp.]